MKTLFGNTKQTGLIVYLALLLFPGRCIQAESVDSLCLHFTSSAENLHLQLKGQYTLSGTLPLTICDLRSDTSYRLLVDGSGLERRIGTFSLDGSGNPEVSGIRLVTTLRNGIIPGWGSVFTGRAVVGWADRLSLLASLYTLVVEDREFRHLKNRYKVWTEKLAVAGSLEEMGRIQNAIHVAALDANTQNGHRRRLAILSAALYCHQLLDPLLSSIPPRMRTESGGSIVRFGASINTELKAFLRSLLRPGMGQFYQGKKLRGGMFSTLTVAAGLVALDFHNRYDMDVNRYNIVVEKFGLATTFEEKLYLKSEASKLWHDVEDERRRRDTACIVLVGLWGWSLIDTLFPAQKDFSASRYSFDCSPGGCTLVYRF